MSNSIKVVIPARFGSTRLPGKPLADICGKPMVVRVCERVRQALPQIDLVVATDDEKVAAVVVANGYQSFISHLPHLSGTDRIAEVATAMGWNDQTKIINVQGDEPLISKAVLRNFCEYVEDISNLEMATVSCLFDSVDDVLDPSKVKVVVSPDGNAVYFSRAAIPFHRELGVSRDNLAYFKKHLGIYAYSVPTLSNIAGLQPTLNELAESLEQLRVLDHGLEIKVLHSESVASPGVDTPEDLEEVREIYRNQNEPY